MEYKLLCLKDTCIHVYCSTIHNSKDLETTQMPISDRLDKEDIGQAWWLTPVIPALWGG